MILTKCAACSAPLPHDAPRCGTCKTRYCNRACQMDHWRRGHKQICKEIHSGGNAEQYHADKKYKEAVAEAVEACADDTKGQTCYICMEDGSEEGLVRGCACRGAAGFVHVSCLARAAQVPVERRGGLGFGRWYSCGLCEQDHHGVVKCALGWACWKTYLGRPEADGPRRTAMNFLGNGLSSAGHHEDALSVREAELSMEQRLGASEQEILNVQGNLASTYKKLGQLEAAMNLQRDNYSRYLRLGYEDEHTLLAANNYADSLVKLQHFEEARSLLRKMIPVAQRVLGEHDVLTFYMKMHHAEALYEDGRATLNDLREAVTTLEETARIARRVLGSAHPNAMKIEQCLQKSRAALRAREETQPSAGSA